MLSVAISANQLSCSPECEVCDADLGCLDYSSYQTDSIPEGILGLKTRRLQCSEGCSQCSDPTSCSACSSGYYLHDTSCLATCPDGLYGNLANNQCVEVCPDGLFSDETNMRCISACDDYAPFEYPALKQCWFYCPSELYANILIMECVEVCADGLYSDETNKRCVSACDDYAPFEYQALKQCWIYCPSHLYEDNLAKECVEACPEGLYSDESYKKCVSACSIYAPFKYTAGMQCWSECPTNLYEHYDIKECMEACPEGMYSDESNMRCVTACDIDAPFTYATLMQCWLDCPDDVYSDLETNECLETCVTGKYANESTMECEKCKNFLSSSKISAKYNYDYTQIILTFSARDVPQYLTNCSKLLDPSSLNLFSPSVTCKIQSDNRSILISLLSSSTKFTFGSLALNRPTFINEGTCYEDGEIPVELYSEDSLLFPRLEVPTQYSLECEVCNLELLGYKSFGVSRFPVEFRWNLTGDGVTEELAEYLGVVKFTNNLIIPKILLQAGTINVELELDNTLGYTISIQKSLEVVVDKILRVKFNSDQEISKPYDEDMRVVAYIYDSCLDTSSITYTWELDTTSNPSYTLTDSAYRVEGSVAWLNRNTLPAGYTYKFIVYAKSEEGVRGYNFLNVYVEYVNPVASIFKGDGDISVNIDLELDGTSSYDPLGMEITYEWTCFFYSKPCPFFASILQDLSDDAVITVKKEDLRVGIEYDFQLKISTPDGRTGYSQILLRALDTPPASISVYSYYRYIYEEPLVINPTVFLPQNGEFKWLQDDSEDIFNIANPYIPTIQIPEYSLYLGESYIYELSLYGNEAYARAYITVRVNSPPSGGTVSVEPRSGEAFSTVFSFDATFFEDVDEDYPLTYGLIAQLVDDTKLYLTLQSLGSSYSSTLSSTVNDAGIRVCDSLNSCTEKYQSVSISDQEYDDETLLERYIQDVDYNERIPAATILYMTNTTLTQDSYNYISDYFLSYLSMLPSVDRVSRQVFYSTFRALLSHTHLLDTERIISYLKTVYGYAASQDDILIAEVDQFFEIFWPVIMNQTTNSHFIGKCIYHLEHIYMNSFRYSAPTLLEHLNTNSTELKARFIASDLNKYYLNMQDYTVSLPLELTASTKVLDIHTQVVTQGSNTIFSLMLAEVGKTEGLNFIEYEVPKVINTGDNQSLKFIFEIPYTTSRRLLQTDSPVFRCKLYTEEKWEYTDCNISLQGDLVRVQMTKLGVFELEVEDYVPPPVDVDVDYDDDEECDTHPAPFIIVGIWFLIGIVGFIVLQTLKSKKPELFKPVKETSETKRSPIENDYSSPPSNEIEIRQDTDSGTKKETSFNQILVQFLKLHVIHEIFRKSQFLYRLLHFIVFLNTMQLGYGLLGTFIFAFTDSDDNQDDSMDNIAEMHYPNDTRYIFMALAIVIPVATPVRFLAKTYNTEVILACTVLTSALMLVSMAGILVMGAVFCMGAVHRWTAMYLIFIPLELVISEISIMVMLFVAGKR